MYYDLSNPFHAEKLRHKLAADIERGKVVEYTEKQTTRTKAQNSYTHVAIRYFALQVGESADYCKRHYFKFAANRDIFYYEKEDKVTHQTVGDLRHISDLSKEELSTAIDKFIRWAWDTAEVYIPSPEDNAQVSRMEMEVENNRRYV
jgi:hypothetical protein